MKQRLGRERVIERKRARETEKELEDNMKAQWNKSPLLSIWLLMEER